MKKRGFGAGRWNGFGGNAEGGETPSETMIREIYEEAGIKVSKLIERGVLNFAFIGNGDTIECHFFHITKWSGEPIESEEMRPQWFEVGKIPYNNMWPDDRYWLPLLLGGKKFKGSFLFGDENEIIKKEIIALK